MEKGSDGIRLREREREREKREGIDFPERSIGKKREKNFPPSGVIELFGRGPQKPMDERADDYVCG